MKLTAIRHVTMCAAFAGALFGQQVEQRNAEMIGGPPDRGVCTVEVRVDIGVDVEIRGITAVVRNLGGQPPEWRRFQCSAPMPPNPADFRFRGIDGRGRQTLIGDPRTNGAAVVRIEDPQGGSDNYRFEITWDGRANYSTGAVYSAPPPPPPPPVRDEDRFRPNYRDSDYFRRYNHGFAKEEAVRICQQAVTTQAARRFPGADIHFEETRMDDGPGRNDWVVGRIEIHRRGGDRDRDRRGGEGEDHRFACSVDFNTGVVRSADLDPR